MKIHSVSPNGGLRSATMGFVFAMGLLVFRVFPRANLKSGFFKNRG